MVILPESCNENKIRIKREFYKNPSKLLSTTTTILTKLRLYNLMGVGAYLIKIEVAI
jgi:hypothetical protein